MFAPNFVYRLQRRCFPVPRESYDIAMYALPGAFKIFYILFNVVPYLALLIVN